MSHLAVVIMDLMEPGNASVMTVFLLGIFAMMATVPEAVLEEGRVVVGGSLVEEEEEEDPSRSLSLGDDISKLAEGSTV